MFENIDRVLNVKKIRYEVLDKILRPYKNNFINDEGTINIFIDLPSTVKQLYNPENLKGFSGKIKFNEKLAIASNLLNMIGHYRHYFASRWMCYTNIYFMYNSKMAKSIQTTYDINYKKDYYDKRINLNNPTYSAMNSLLKDNYKYMIPIIKCIPNAHFIDTGEIDYRVIFNYLIRNRVDDKDLNIILTTDKIFYQNVNYKNTVILEPRGDRTKFIYYGNAIKELAGTSKTIQKNPDYVTINPENIILLESLINHKDYNIEGIRNFSYAKAIIFLNKNEIDIGEIITDPETVIDLFKDFITDDEVHKIKKNFNIFNNQRLMEMNDNKLDIIMPPQLDHFEDPESVRKVNEKYFYKYPLLTNYMWEGEA